MARTPKPLDDETPTADEIIGQLDALDALQLGRVITAAEERRGAKVQKAREALIARVREEAGALGLDPAELFAHPTPAPAKRSSPNASRKKGSGTVPVKYRSKDMTKDWSGRGKTPSFITEYEATGGNREDLRVPEPGRSDSQPDLIEQARREHGE